MFTVKFIKRFRNGDEVKTSVSCARYDIHETGLGTCVTTFATDTVSDGAVDSAGRTRMVDNINDVEHYDHCYVENMSGKTIAHYEAPLPLPVVEELPGDSEA